MTEILLTGTLSLNSIKYYVQVNNLLIISGQVLQGLTSTKQPIKCLAQGHNTE